MKGRGSIGKESLKINPLIIRRAKRVATVRVVSGSGVFEENKEREETGDGDR